MYVYAINVCPLYREDSVEAKHSIYKSIFPKISPFKEVDNKYF